MDSAPTQLRCDRRRPPPSDDERGVWNHWSEASSRAISTPNTMRRPRRGRRKSRPA